MSLWRFRCWARSRVTSPRARSPSPPTRFAGSPTWRASASRSAASAPWPLRGSRTWLGWAFAPCSRGRWRIILPLRLRGCCWRSKTRSEESEVRIENPKSKIQNQPGYAEAMKAARYLRARCRWPPRVAIILGSGLGEAVRLIRSARIISYRSVPHFPPSRIRVEGHAGKLHLGLWNAVPVAVLAGRLHLYEGYSPAEVVFPVRLFGLAGVKMLLVSCAVGGIARQAAPGSFMIFSDHLNWQGQNPLAG